MKGFFRGIGAAFSRKKTLAGGKRPFIADKVKKSRRVKEITRLDLYAKKEQTFAAGVHGVAFDLIVYRGKHKTRLVVKRYHECDQTKTAEKEFAAFQALKQKGFLVPQTVRLVKIRGKKYVALTDLSRFGDIQTKFHRLLSLYIGAGKAQTLIDYTRGQNQKAKAELGINIEDSWEFVIDSKTRTAKPIILDLTDEFYDPK